jgi:hypothetical protein
MLLTVQDGNGNPQVIIPNAQATLFTDYSGTITTGGTAQKLLPASMNRSGWFIQNQHATEALLVYDLGVPASWALGSGAVSVAPGATYPNAIQASGVSVAAIWIYAASSAHPFSCRSW